MGKHPKAVFFQSANKSYVVRGAFDLSWNIPSHLDTNAGQIAAERPYIPLVIQWGLGLGVGSRVLGALGVGGAGRVVLVEDRLQARTRASR